LKGENKMLQIKIGNFPGELKEFAIEKGTTVQEALAMANISVGAEQEIKLDGEVVEPSHAIESGNLLLVTKRLKGATR
jgi:hypothetical protein